MGNHARPAMAPHVQAAIRAAAGPHIGAQTIQRYEGHAYHNNTKAVFRGPNARAHDSSYFEWEVPEFVEGLRWQRTTIELSRESERVYRLEVFLYEGGQALQPKLLCFVELRGPIKVSPTLNYVRTGYACLDLTGKATGDLKIYADPAAYGSREVKVRADGVYESIARITEARPEGWRVLRSSERDEPSGPGRGRLVEASTSPRSSPRILTRARGPSGRRSTRSSSTAGARSRYGST